MFLSSLPIYYLSVDLSTVRLRFGWNRVEYLIETSNQFGLVVDVFFHGLSVRFTVRFGSVRYKFRSGAKTRKAMIKRQD